MVSALWRNIAHTFLDAAFAAGLRSGFRRLPFFSDAFVRKRDLYIRIMRGKKGGQIMSTKERNILEPLKMPKVASPASRGVEEEWCADPTLSTVELTPLEARLAAKSPELVEGLKKLRAAIGEEAYAKHISELPNLTRNAQSLLVVAKSFMQRSLLERDYIPKFREAFGVADVRIVA